MRRGASGLSALLAIDKPTGMTSHDVVARVRRIYNEKRIGHTGTLDPDASGVLVLGIGQAARLMGILTSDQKAYDVTICFGRETDTGDASGTVVFEKKPPHELGNIDEASAYVSSLVGEHDQVPPNFSAVSVNGKRAYQRAREGETFKLSPRRVSIIQASVTGVSVQDNVVRWDCSFLVSKGCYIRSIARDMGRHFGCGAHVGSLRRTSAGSVSLGACTTLAKCEAEGTAGFDRCILDPCSVIDFPTYVLDDYELSQVQCGRAFVMQSSGCSSHGCSSRGVCPPCDERMCVVAEGRLWGIWRKCADKLVSEINFTGGIAGVRNTERQMLEAHHGTR